MTLDLKINIKMYGGRAKCHDGTDFQLTPSGDIALTSDVKDMLMQRLALWTLTPKGELTDPKAGCSIYTSRHAKVTRESMDFLAGELLMDLRYAFPEWIIKSVTCYAVYGTNNQIDNGSIGCCVETGEEVIDLLLSVELSSDGKILAASLMR